jgi:hypothetical protein
MRDALAKEGINIPLPTGINSYGAVERAKPLQEFAVVVAPNRGCCDVGIEARE